MSVVIEAKGLVYAVQGRRLIDEASLQLEVGRLLAIVGPNGAGKSSLLRLLTGERAPSAGEIFYRGEALGTAPAWRLAEQRAVMAQNAAPAFPFTVREVAELGLATLGRRLCAAQAEEIVAASLEAAGVAALAAREFPTLSGGEQQRARFARALCQLRAGRLVGGGVALFLDEPTASLDLEHQFAVMRAARALADQGVAVTAVLHDLTLAAGFADRIAMVAQGKIVAQGAPEEVLTSDRIAEVFRIRLDVSRHAASGRLVLLPTAGDFIGIRAPL